MAVRTFTTAGVNNLWSNPANWDTGIPVNNDTAIIPIGETAEFNVDQSGFANGITVQVNAGGMIYASTTAGAYIMKLSANMALNGTLRAGTAGVPYPLTCSFEIRRNGFQITVGAAGVLDLHCTEPANKIIKLSGVEAIGQTILSVDTDVTGDPAWIDGATIRIDDINAGVDSEERIIAAGGIAANTITVTVGLAAQKEIGALLILSTRNVRITHTVAAAGDAISGGSNGQIGAEIRTGRYAISAGTNHTVSIITGFTAGMIYCQGGTVTTISGCSNGIASYAGITVTTISGCNNGIYTSSGNIIETISGCLYAVNGGGGNIVTNIVGCFGGIYFGSDNTLVSGGSFVGNTNDLSFVSNATFRNVLFGGVVEFSGYSSAYRLAHHYVESFDHDQVANAFKAWCRGGVVTSNLVTVPPGKPLSYQHACENASYPCFRQIRVTVEPGKTLAVVAQMRKDALMAWLPRLQVIDPYSDPLVDAANPPLATASMTDSLNTWETISTSWTNAGTVARWVLVRLIAMNAANNFYEYADILVGGRRPRIRWHGV